MPSRRRGLTAARTTATALFVRAAAALAKRTALSIP